MEQAWNQRLGPEQKRVHFIRRYFSRPADLVECIMQYRPSILHFGCHGTEKGLNLAFNSFVTNEQLADALESLNRGRTPVQLVVANACWSSAAAQALGERLDFVIGHELPVKDSDAIGFSTCLYQQIADGKTLQEAFNVAKMCSRGYQLQGLADASRMMFVTEAESLEDEVERVGVGYMDTRQYTARPRIMGKLKAALLEAAGAQRVAVVGQGGSGKSTLARGLLEDVGVSDKGASGVRLVFFVSGRDSGDVARGYRELMQALSGLLGRRAPADSGSGKETEEEVRAFVHSALRDRALKHRWVGVMDDLPSPCASALEEAGLSWLLATDAGGFPWGSGKTLVTSRFHGWKETFGGVGEVVGSFEEEEAHALLADKVEHWRDQPAGIKDVARRLAYFPLALASAAGCAKAFRLEPHQYLAELERCRSELLEDWNSRAKTAGDYPHEFFQVMHVTWQRLAEGQHAETVMELLRMLAFVDPCDIPITLFQHLRRHLPVLTEHCLVTVSAAGAHVSMHALTQQVLREHLMGNASNHALAAATAQVCDRMHEFDAKHGTYAAGRRYAPHAKAVLSHADAPASPDVADLAYQLGLFYRDVAFAFADARRMLERSLSVWRALGTAEESLQVANCYAALGVLCYDQGRMAEAATHYERSLAIFIKVHGTEEHPSVAAGLNSMGSVLQAQGRMTEAATHYERSLAIYIKVHGTEEHPDVARSLHNMGSVLEAQGRLGEAATHYERSLAIYTKVHGTEEHFDVARTRRNLESLRDLMSA